MQGPSKGPSTGGTWARWIGIVTSLGAVCSVIGMLVALGLRTIQATYITGGIMLILLVVAYVVGHYAGLRSFVLGHIRRTVLYWLTSIIIEIWETHVNVEANGDAKVVNTIKGKVNFGINRYLPTRIRPDAAQGTFGVAATDNTTGQPLGIETMLSAPTFKEIRIHFPQELRRGDKFDIALSYDVKSTFFFGKEDYYGHRANHYEKKILMIVDFPKSVAVSSVYGEVVSEHGDVWADTEKPSLDHTRREGDRAIWLIEKAFYGNTHTMRWMSNLVSPSAPSTGIRTT